MLFVLLGVAALAVDVGYLRYQQRIQQTATDSAAFAGANELSYGAGGNVTNGARGDAALNGFTHDGTNIVVTVNTPYSGNASAVEVIIVANHPTFFERVLGVSVQSVKTRAVALLSTTGPAQCVYALGGGATNMNGTTINAPNCGIIVDGDLSLNGTTITMASIGVVGSFSSNPANAQETVALPATDPCPRITGCAYLAANPPATAPCPPANTNLSINGGSATLFPGVYCGAVSMNGANVTFQPGVYVFNGGLNVNGGTLTGTGVTFYLAGQSVNSNGVTWNLIAPTSGPTVGMLFYQPPSNTTSANFNGSGGSGLAGALYLPTATLTSNGSFGTWLMIIASNLLLNGATINVPAIGSALPGTSHAVMAE